jgi:Ceramidase
MTSQRRQGLLLTALAAGGITAAFFLPPIPQDPAYHAFADRRTLFGIASFWNVVSNLPFIAVGIFALGRLSRVPHDGLQLPCLLLGLGVILVGIGSAYYHYRPTTATLVWDRLPMTMTFMALFSLVVSDRVSEPLGRALLWPLICAGAASVAYWYWRELDQRGDLRAYAVVQFLPLLLIPAMLLTSRGRWLSTGWLWGVLAAYLLAKAAESGDGALYDFMGFGGGHSLKHVLAAAAVLMAVLAVTGKRLADKT